MATSALTATTYASSLHGVGRSVNELANSIYRISSSNKYVTGEDTASLTLATQLQANAVASRQGLKNSVQTSSLLEIASGALSQISDLLATARATAVAAQKDTLTDAERTYLQTSLSSDLAALDDIAATKRFNEIYVLNGSLSNSDGGTALTYATGSGTGNSITIDIRDASTDRLLGGTTPSLLTADDADVP